MILLPALGAGSLERAEIYFLDGARAMVERGDWLVPYYRGEPFFDKPPVTYWLIAASFRVFGFGAEAARIVPAAAATGLILATLWLGTLLFDRPTARAAGWILATTFGFMTFGRVAMSDMLLALWTTLAFALAVRLFAGSGPPWILPMLGAVLGLGFATKGPVALLLPGLGVLALAWRKPWPRVGPTSLLLAGVAFGVLGLGWFVAVYLRLGAGPLEHFFLRENVERFAGQTYDSGRSPWFYLGTYLSEGAPWSAFLPLVAWRELRRPRPGEAAPSSLRLLFAWMALMLVPLSLSRGKIDYYLLPLYPPASLAVARLFAAADWDVLERRWIPSALVIIASVFAALPFVLAGIPSPWLGSSARMAASVVAWGAALALLAAAIRPRPGRVLATVAASSAGVFLAGVTLLVPAFVSAQPNAAIVADVLRERSFRPDVSVALCTDPTRAQRDLLFHARLAVLERCDLWFPASSERPFLLLLQRNERDSLRALRQFRLVAGYDYLPSAVVNVERLLEALEPQPLFLAANFPSTDPVLLEEIRRRVERRERIERRREALSPPAPGTIPP